MPNALKNGLNSAVNVFKGAFGVRDTESLDSQVERSDLTKPDSEPATGDEEVLINLGEERFEEARVGRWAHNARAFSGIAMFQDKMDCYWDEESGSMQPLPGLGGNSNPDFQERMRQSYWNIIRRTAEGAVARITASVPDSWAAPQTDNPADKQAAQIMRAVNAHCGRITNRAEMLEEALLVAFISTTCFIEVGWDWTKWADVGIPQPDGSIAYHRAQIGDVCNHLMLCIDAYPDPNASLANGDIHNGAYFIKRCTRTLAFIQEKWGKTVQATSVSSTYGFLEQRLEWIAGDRSRQMAKMDHCTDVTEVWEKPSKRYPKGRFWVYSADKTMLYCGEWPYKNEDGTPYADKYPFVPVAYQKNQASIWALNGVDSLKPIQRTLNRLATYLNTRLEWDRPTLFVSDQAGISPEDFQAELGKIVPFEDKGNGDAGIQWNQPPAPPAWLFDYWKQLIQQSEYISGIHDFNADTATPPNSGKELELRVQQERDRLGPPTRHAQNVIVELQTWDGVFYRQFGTQFPRLLGVDDKGNTGQDAAQAQLVDLRALKNGAYRVVLAPGSGASKTMAAKEERLDEIMKVLASPNMNPALAKFYLSQCDDIRSDAQTDELMVGLQAYYASQSQQAAQVQQMKGDQAQQQLAQKTQQEQQAAQIAQQTAEAEAAIRVHSETQIQGARSIADQEAQNSEARQAMVLENAKFEHQMAILQANHQAPPSYSVSAKLALGPTASIGAEEAMGLPADSPKEVKEAAQPPPKAPIGPPKKAS